VRNRQLPGAGKRNEPCDRYSTLMVFGFQILSRLLDPCPRHRLLDLLLVFFLRRALPLIPNALQQLDGFLEPFLNLLNGLAHRAFERLVNFNCSRGLALRFLTLRNALSANCARFAGPLVSGGELRPRIEVRAEGRPQLGERMFVIVNCVRQFPKLSTHSAIPRSAADSSRSLLRFSTLVGPRETGFRVREPQSGPGNALASGIELSQGRPDSAVAGRVRGFPRQAHAPFGQNFQLAFNSAEGCVGRLDLRRQLFHAAAACGFSRRMPDMLRLRFIPSSSERSELPAPLVIDPGWPCFGPEPDVLQHRRDGFFCNARGEWILLVDVGSEDQAKAAPVRSGGADPNAENRVVIVGVEDASIGSDPGVEQAARLESRLDFGALRLRDRRKKIAQSPERRPGRLRRLLTSRVCGTGGGSW